MRRLGAGSCLGLGLIMAAASLRADPGTTAANFLKIGVGPRPVAMGETFAGVADDINAVFYNPAGLANLRRQEASFMYNKFFEGVSQQWAAYAYPHADWGTVGLAFNMVSVAPFNAYDVNDQPIGTVSSADMSFGLSYARVLAWPEHPLSMGLTFKYLLSRLAVYKADAVAVDMGTLWREHEKYGFGVGASVQNIGTSMKFISEAFPLPVLGRAGLSYAFPIPAAEHEMSLLFAVDGNFSKESNPFVSGGMEFMPIPQLALRVGYRGNQDAGLGISAGIGFMSFNRAFSDWFPDLSIDYAFVDFGPLEQTHRVSISARFGQDRKSTVNSERDNTSEPLRIFQ